MSTSAITGDPNAATRRRVAGALAAALLSLVAGQAAAERAITFVSWGGAYTRSQILAFVRPYEARTEVPVEVIDYAGGLDEIRAQVRSLNVKWDVVDLELSDAIRGCAEGLLVPIDPDRLVPAPDGTPPRKDFIDGSLTRCGVGTVMWSTVIAYDPAAFQGDPPTRLADFFDLERFPGPRALRKTPKANLEWALMADGLARDQVYAALETEAGLQRALEVLERIKPQLRWWEAGAEAPRLLETGRVAMTSAYHGRIYDAVRERQAEMAVIWDGQIWNIDLLAVLRGNPQQARALDFIRFATSTAALARQARHIPYGPVRKSSLQRLDPATLAQLPSSPQHLEQGLKIDARWWARNYERINRRFEQWLEQPVRVPQALPR